MQVTYKNDIKVAGIGLVPWTRLGPERWLKNYKIASLYGVDAALEAHLPEILSLSARGKVPELPRLNTAALLATPEFRRLLTEDLAGYTVLPYKAVTVPPELQDRQFLMVNSQFTKLFENKVAFRELFGETLTFPAYVFVLRSALGRDEASYRDVAAGREAFVIQDEQLSGGKGTFIIRSYDDYIAALAALDRLSKDKKLVISDIVERPRERSIQACVTNKGVVTGPLQRQLVRNPLLANMDVPEGDKWCGAQIYAADQSTGTHLAAQHVAETVGKELAARGYKGIFGVDFLLGADEVLYTIEVNPRITGVTPLLAALYDDQEGVPFYLLHILELGGYPYEITDMSARFEKDGALLMLHSLENTEMYIESMPKSGTYRIENDQLVRVGDALQLADLKSGEWILQEYLPPGMAVKPGGRLATLLTREQTIDTDNDMLYNETTRAISAFRADIKMRSVA